MEQPKKTALYPEHQKAKAKMIDFGGWMMPVSYTSVIEEHHTVREKVGVFDVSHMGEVRVRGKQAAEFLQYLTINDVSSLQDGGGQYSAMCHKDGGIIDDLILYRLEKDHFLACINASNRDKDFQWMTEVAQSFADLDLKNESDQWSQLALQGPLALPTLLSLPFSSLDAAKLSALPYTHIAEVSLFGTTALIARTGYTGEKGYELYLNHDCVVKVWQHFIENQASSGLSPIGLGARDTLRLESCYLLYGNDINETTTPLEAGIGWATKLNTANFIGKDALIKQKQSGVPRQMHAFKLLEAGVPRHGMQILLRDEVVGEVTSGSVLPTVGGTGGMALIRSGLLKLDDEFEIDVRGKRKLARVVRKPLYNARVKD
jgi:aminomethyltransferase